MALRDLGYGVTTVKAFGAKGPVEITYVACKRKDVPQVIKIVNSIEPSAFMTIQDIRSHLAGYFRKDSFFSNIFNRK